jgi:catechol 2,3-dioxygenase-like lactoylglutathione lyase family enzyme
MNVFPKQRANLITLGVKDLAVAKKFYTQILGWMPWKEIGDIICFDMNGFILCLFPDQALAADMAQPSDRQPSKYPGFSLSYNARSEVEVDEIFGRLRARNVSIIKNPQKAEWGGYSGYFCDPDGHAWEVAYNPFWALDADGRIDTEEESAA